MSSTYPRVWLDSVEMTDQATGRYGLDPSMPPRVTNMPSIVSVSVPGRDGSLWTPQGAHPSPLFTVVVLVAGAGSSKDALFADTEDIVEMFGGIAGRPKIDIKYLITATRGRFAYGRVSTFDVVRPALDYAVVTIVLELLSPFWSDRHGPTTFSRPGKQLMSLPPEMIGNAPILDAKINIIGPANVPKVTDIGSGDWFQYYGAVLASEQLLFDAATLRGRKGPRGVVKWASGGTSVDPNMSWGGTGAYAPNSFRVAPYPTAVGARPSAWAAKLQLTAGSMNAATKLEIQARKALR